MPGADDVADAVLSAVFTNGRTVVAAVEMERLDVEEKAARLGGVEGRCEQNGVVVVRTVGRPTDRDAPSVGDERPLPAELSPVSGVSSAPLAARRRLVLGAVDARLGEVEPDDAVIAGDRLGDDGVVEAGRKSLVTARPGGRVRDDVAAEPLGVLPRTPRRKTHDHHPEAVSITGSRAVTTEGVAVVMGREQLLDRRPDGIEHFGVERAHDGGDLRWSSGGVSTRQSSWAFTATGGWSLSIAYPRGLLVDLVLLGKAVTRDCIWHGCKKGLGQQSSRGRPNGGTTPVKWL